MPSGSKTATATLPHPPRKRGPLESSEISQRRGLKTSPSLRKLIKHVHPHLSSLIPPSCRLLYLFRRCEDVTQRRSKVPLLVQTNLMVPAGFLPVSDLRCFQSRCHLAVLQWRACCRGSRINKKIAHLGFSAPLLQMLFRPRLPPPV